MSTPSIFRRYKWEDLSEPERDAVRTSISIVSARAAIGVGVVASVAAGIAAARRGKPPLPPGTKYTSLGFFMFLGAYGGFLSAGPLCAQQVLSVPNSRLADDLRSAIGDWQARSPVPKGSPSTPVVDTGMGTDAKG